MEAADGLSVAAGVHAAVEGGAGAEVKGGVEARWAGGWLEIVNRGTTITIREEVKIGGTKYSLCCRARHCYCNMPVIILLT